ncbi:MAG: hypothetical protein M3436_19980 [Pseudomonadota bacterium]|nr:hypothetical protein [Pseudomonadota bacterium]
MKLPLLLAVSLTACLHTPVADPAGDEVLRELASRTRETVADGDARRLSLRQSRNFLRQSQATVAALRARSQVSRISAHAHSYLDTLDHQYAVLLEQSQPLRTSTSAELQTTLAALQNMRPFTSGWRSVPNAPGNFDPFDATYHHLEKCKKKDHNKKDRRDRRDKDGKKAKDKKHKDDCDD